MTASTENINRITQSLEQLILSTPALRQHPDDFYTFSYPHFIAVFARHTKFKTWDEEAVVFGLSAVYAWMPTAIRSYNPHVIADLPAILNAGGTPDTLVPLMIQCVNNSLVAGSKFLHLYSPDVYPIVDSNTESWIWPSTASRLANPSVAQLRYFEFIAGVNAVSSLSKLKAKDWSQKWFGYETTATRAIEAMVFYVARRNRLPHA